MPSRPPVHRHQGWRTEEQRKAEYDARRKDDEARKLYSYRWSQTAKGFLRAHPLCAHCLAEGRTMAATEVDHIRPHRGDRALFWDRNNWQALCKSCHSRKTATEDSGFAGPRR